MSQRQQTCRAWCDECEDETRHTRFVTNMGCGDLFMVCLTFGLWLLARALFPARWHCDRCGA